MGDRPRVGVFGGTFDPPHIGHLAAAEAVVRHAGLDRLLWVPVASPPHKARGPWAPAEIRREMVAAAIRGRPEFELLELELARGGVSYTIDTVRELGKLYPEWSLAVVMGAELWVDFASWREAEAIVRMADIIVMSRPGQQVEEDVGVADVRTLMVRVPLVHVSSSLIRQRLRLGGSVRAMLSPGVASIVDLARLYRGEKDAVGAGGATREPEPGGDGDLQIHGVR